MLLYIMLYIVLAYLMQFAALTNAVCLNNASFFFIDLCKCFLFSCFVIVYFFFFICIMHSAFNMFVFLIICSHHCHRCFFIYFFLRYFLDIFYESAMSSPEK